MKRLSILALAALAAAPAFAQLDPTEQHLAPRSSSTD